MSETEVLHTHVKVDSDRSSIPEEDGLIKVTSRSAPYHVVNHAMRLLTNPDRTQIKFSAVAGAIPTLIAAVHMVKVQCESTLYQQNHLGSIDTGLDYVPIVQGHDKVHQKKALAFMSVVLSRTPLDETDVGYQPSGTVPVEPTVYRSADFFLDRARGAFRGRRGFRGRAIRGGFRGRRGFSRGGRGGFRGGFRGRYPSARGRGSSRGFRGGYQRGNRGRGSPATPTQQ
ncbi:hypothetical protein P9112_008653 [Eukaryota sp. TZLM1-RC]